MTASPPEVHVIIPVFNAGELVIPSIQSLKQQTYSNIRFIIHDDGSKEQNRQLVREAIGGDRRFVKPVEHAVNRGNSAVRKDAVAHSRELNPDASLMFVDLDGDIIHPQHTERAVLQMQKTKADLCWLNCGVVAATPDLETAARNERQKLEPSKNVLKTIAQAPKQIITLENSLAIPYFTYLNVATFYSGKVKRGWIDADPNHRLPDLAFAAQRFIKGRKITGLSPDEETYQYLVRSGSVTEHGKRELAPVNRAAEARATQLNVMLDHLGEMNTFQRNAVGIFVNLRQKEQMDLYNTVDGDPRNRLISEKAFLDRIELLKDTYINPVSTIKAA